MNANRDRVARFATAPHKAAGAGGSRLVRVRDLVLPASIGVYDHEKGRPQRICVNVELKVREGDAPIEDDIANVLSYEDVIDGIKRIIAEGHINLVETLAERIAAFCLTDSRVDCVRIGVDKLDIVPEAAAVGVEIERSR